MNDPIKTIAVDLTPILPGGENGGAKIFVLELLLHLAELVPQTQFFLLTHAVSHDELSLLDRSNMRRLMVVGVNENSMRSGLIRLASRLMTYLPARSRRIFSRLGYRLNTMLKRRSSEGLLRRLKVDLLFCPFTAPTYFEAGIPTVCTIYDLQYKTYPDFFSSEDVAHRDRTFIEACRRASALTAISEYSRETAITHGNLDPSSIRTIHLRMSQRISLADGTKVLDRLELVSYRYLICPANFWKHKNHQMLLTAFGIACREGLPSDIKLVCTGAPGLRQECLINAARAMNLDERILFPGYLATADLAVLMSHACGMVFPSLYEGFGLPIIEAMAAGVPVACSNTTSLPEVAANAAILFDPRIPTQIAQVIVTLVGDAILRAQLIEAGKKRAMEFADSTRMAKEYWELFLYAFANVKHQNLLAGIYADGWAGPQLNVQVAPGELTQAIELEFFAPDWLPQQMLTIQVSQGGKPYGRRIELNRGASRNCSIPVHTRGGIYEIHITPTFIPAHTGHGNDHREISALVRRCDIVSSEGASIELFSGQAST